MSNIQKYYFGIDFGTTNIAAVCYSVHGEKIDVFKYGDLEDRTLPAVVAIDRETNEVITGREAKDRRMELSERCAYISSVKTILDDEDWELETNGKYWYPADIAAEIFKMVKKEVLNKSKIELNETIVSIPIGFGEKKRKKLREAAMLAGLNITRLISEPTAAYFANIDFLKSSENIVIFDWGGGTLDISVLRNDKGRISELSTGGMDIAGDKLDNKISKRIHEKITRKQTEIIALEKMPAEAQDILLERCERAKRNLTDSDTATISINNYGDYGACRETLYYDWFSDIIAPEIDMAISCLKNVIKDSGENIANIDKIVMVGGSSNLRPLQEKIIKIFGDKIYFPEETMWNVGQGTAWLSMKPGKYYTNQKIGIILCDGSFFELLSTDLEIEETKKICHFGLVDTTEEVRIIFSGCPDIDKSSNKYATINFPAYRFLQEQIIITTEVDQDLIFIAKIESKMRPEEFSRTWIYTNLKFYYKLDGSKEARY
ncbi:MAG: Hsp70 family protein [Treponema sp.]|nr:Hsp70 family protein [Treponema sp.]